MNKVSIFRIDLQFNISHVRILCVTLLKDMYKNVHFVWEKRATPTAILKEQLNNVNIEMHP